MHPLTAIVFIVVNQNIELRGPQTIPVHQERARVTSAEFNDLVNDVELFEVEF